VEIVVPVVVIDIPIWLAIVVGGCRTKARAASPAPWRGESRQARQKSCCPAALPATPLSPAAVLVVLSHGIADETTIYSGGSPLMRSRLRSTASPCPGAPEVGTGQGEAEPEMFQCHCDTGLLNLTKFR
jgi:hypothetical protein